MELFNLNYDRPGPGVSPNTPRKKGWRRLLEVLGRDMWDFFRAGLLALVSALPYAFGVWFSIATHALLPLLAAGVLGGMILAPQLCGLYDTILRSLRDEPGFWWTTYRRAWKTNLKPSLVPGAVGGVLLAMQAFVAAHLVLEQGTAVAVALLLGVLCILALGQYVLAQVVLLNMGFGGILRNAVLLFFAYLPRTALGVVWQVAYWAAIALLYPLSTPVVVLCNFWVPALLSLMAIYPGLDQSFSIEENIRKMREEQLQNKS